MIVAHGIGSVRDLPLPTWLFFWAGAVVLVLSFLALGTLWKQAQLERRAEGRPLPAALELVLRSRALRIVLGAVSSALLVLVFLTALLGEPSAATNLAPTFVYVVFWLGIVAVQIVLGNVWPVLNPWLALADATAWLWGKLGRTWTPPLSYPPRLGVYPAALLLFAYTALELCYWDPAAPRALALAIALYSYVTWFGMAAFGRRIWIQHGEAFSVYFGLFAQVAPFGESNGRLIRRLPFAGLTGSDRRPGLLLFIAVMLGSVAFDGLSRSARWQDLRARIEGPYVLDSPGLADALGALLALAGLVGCVVLVVVTYRIAVQAAQAAVKSGRPLAAEFLRSLVPIALVYAAAHYLTLLLVQGQYALPLASDPFGYDWDLVGLADYQPNLAPLAPNTIWYAEVAALVTGHVAGLAVAHDRALQILPERGALRSQYAMLALMVTYTVGGLWLLSQN